MSEVYVDRRGYAHDDEGNTWKVPKSYMGTHKSGDVPVPGRQGMVHARGSDEKAMVAAISKATWNAPGGKVDRWIHGIWARIKGGKLELSDEERQLMAKAMVRIGMKKEAKLFEDQGGANMRAILERIDASFLGRI